MREVMTVHVGGFANFVGSHFWNFQVIDDELLGLADDPGADPVFRTAAVDMDVLYRAGETHQGVATYCPVWYQSALESSRAQNRDRVPV